MQCANSAAKSDPEISLPKIAVLRNMRHRLLQLKTHFGAADSAARERFAGKKYGLPDI
jgi:hypothetical protein